MNSKSATGLERLNDIVLPPSVPWWPLAPGWYVVLFLLFLAVAWLVWRQWTLYRANRYRREALQLLATLKDAPAIAELLRRTALAFSAREEIAVLSGHQWVEWLATCCSTEMPEPVRELLLHGIYNPGFPQGDMGALRAYAADWIAGHRQKRSSAPRSA